MQCLLLLWLTVSTNACGARVYRCWIMHMTRCFMIHIYISVFISSDASISLFQFWYDVSTILMKYCNIDTIFSTVSKKYTLLKFLRQQMLTTQHYSWLSFTCTAVVRVRLFWYRKLLLNGKYCKPSCMLQKPFSNLELNAWIEKVYTESADTIQFDVLISNWCIDIDVDNTSPFVKSTCCVVAHDIWLLVISLWQFSVLSFS